jgi:hypothetical protein
MIFVGKYVDTFSILIEPSYYSINNIFLSAIMLHWYSITYSISLIGTEKISVFL